jgi:glycosidase
VASYWLAPDSSRTEAGTNKIVGLDGFRLDAVKHVYTAKECQTNQSNDLYSGDGVYEANVTKNINFFNEFSARLKAVNPDIFIVGENFDGNNDNIAPYVNSIDSQFSFPAFFSLSSELDQEKPNASFYVDGYYQFAYNRAGIERNKIVNKVESEFDKVFIDSPFTSNHDVKRAINRVNGDMNIKGAARDYLEKRGKLWASTILTLPGMPWIFYGDELGMSSNLYPNEYGNPNSFMDRYYRQPFKWEHQMNEQTTAFYVEAWMVEWEEYNLTLDGVKEQRLNPGSVLNTYQRLLTLKNTNLALQRGHIILWNTSTPGLMVYERVYKNQRVVIYHNYSNKVISGFRLDAMPNSKILYETNQNLNATSLSEYSSMIVSLN